MPIFGQNSILNVFVPKFLLKTPLDGQMLVWDSDVNGFVNVSVPNVLNGGMTAEQLKQFGIMKLYTEAEGVLYTTADPTNIQVTAPAPPAFTFRVDFGSTTVFNYATIVWGDGSSPTIITSAQIRSGSYAAHTYADGTPRTITVTLYNPYGLGTPGTIQVTPTNT